MRAAKKNTLKPWQVKRYCLPTPSAKFVSKMEDVLAVYARPYDVKRPVVCSDEASKELHTTPHGSLPAKPGRGACEDYEYQRNGTANLFMQVEPLTGKRRVRVSERRTSYDFAEQLRQMVEEDYPEVDVVVFITDNLNTHTPACLYERFEPEHARAIAAKIEWHYTPEHGSWLNMAECELSVLSRQCLNRRIPDRDTLAAQVAAWEHERNQQRVTIDWQFTAQDARVKLKRLYPVLKTQNLTG